MLSLSAGMLGSVSADDMETVKQVFEKCGITEADPASVVIIEEGSVVSLDLNNKEITQDGISFLPPEIGMLSNLRVLSCSGNIIDSLPVEIGNLSNLKKLDCSSNRITMLPAAIGNLTKLTHLDMRHNRLAILPPEIGKCKSLVLLQLWGNKLTSIDEAVVRLPALKELYLKDNRLTALPKSIVKLDLGYLDVMGNKLCDLPPEVDKWIRKRDARYRELQKCW